MKTKMRSPGAAFDLRAAMTQELNAALEELDSGGPKALHRCRVRLKRARALARVGKVVAPGLASVFNESARSVMRTLAQSHELATLADTARILAETAGEKDAEALVATADSLDAARDALPPFDDQAVRVPIRDLIALAQVWPEPSPRQIRSGAKRIAKRARRLRRRGRDAKGLALRHDWRKREKDRFYAASLMERAWPGRRQRKPSQTLGHLLGLERDALLLIERLETEPALAGDASGATRARRVLRKYCVSLRKRANKLGDRLQAEGA
jgi:hypothetical protein